MGQAAGRLSFQLPQGWSSVCDYLSEGRTANISKDAAAFFFDTSAGDLLQLDLPDTSLGCNNDENETIRIVFV